MAAESCRSELQMAKVLLVAGARPNFMKVASVLRALARYPKLDTRLVHTGQHYDESMSSAFLEQLGLPRPDVYLGIGSGTQATQTARVMLEFERVVAAEAPDAVVVVGDVNSTLGCAVVTAKATAKLAHVEAGLRSFDRTMPEEINRVLTDSVSDLFFTTSEDAGENLLREGHDPDSIHFVGNTMIDTLHYHESTFRALEVSRRLGLERGRYILTTLHRPSNVDDPSKLRAILKALARAPLRVVFPIHPRTRMVAERAGMKDLLDTAGAVSPLGYLEFLSLQADAAVVLTDSGGVQEETTALGVPCLTFRDNTERPVTITQGTNRLIGSDPVRILPELNKALKNPPRAKEGPPLWDGRAGERIAEVLERLL